MKRKNKIKSTVNDLDIEEILESLKITEEYTSDRNRTTESATSEEMLTAPIPVVYDKTAYDKTA